MCGPFSFFQLLCSLPPLPLISEININTRNRIERVVMAQSIAGKKSAISQITKAFSFFAHRQRNMNDISKKTHATDLEYLYTKCKEKRKREPECISGVICSHTLCE